MRRFSSEKFDGATWHTYETDSGYFFLTSQGRKEFAAGGIARLLRAYANETSDSKDDATPLMTRRFLAEGANAQVFSVGSYPYVVKERKADGDNLLASLNRMDTLINVIEEHAPRWIDMPKHLGVYFPRRKPDKQFMLMQKIDSGISAGDVFKFARGPENARQPRLFQDVKDTFGDITPELAEEVHDRYRSIYNILKSALVSEHLSPDVYLPDLDGNPDNLVLEKLDTPIGGSQIKYWVIDQ